MADYKKLCMQSFEEKDLHYEEVNERAIRLGFSADNIKNLDIYLAFGENGSNDVHGFTSFASVPPSKRDAVVSACNELNNTYRWVSFYVDDEGDLYCVSDSYFIEEDCGDACAAMVDNLVTIVDDAYPTVMKAIWA